ncbi:hypothetical protein D3C72_1926680 [compost metagenome]
MRSIKASAALWPEPTMAMRIAWPLAHGRFSRLFRYWEWWNTRGSALNGANAAGIFGVPPLPTTTERARRRCSWPFWSREIRRR